MIIKKVSDFIEIISAKLTEEVLKCFEITQLPSHDSGRVHRRRGATDRERTAATDGYRDLGGTAQGHRICQLCTAAPESWL